MDSNKGRALTSVRIAEAAIESGDKIQAFKFIRIAKRLDPDLPVDELLVACEKLNLESNDFRVVDEDRGESLGSEGSNGVSGFADEHVEVIERVMRDRDYYAVLGVDKGCSGEDIKRAYKKLSLKVHPDKNKARGAEEAFKKVCKVFKCLSEEESRKRYDYDQLVFIGECQCSDRSNVPQWRRRRRRRNTFDDIYENNRPNVFRTSYVYRSKGMHNPEGDEPREKFILLFLQILPLLLFVLLVGFTLFEPKYSLHKNHNYPIPRTTEKHGVEFFVKSATFDQRFPLGSLARLNMEDNVFKDYKHMLWRYCHTELQRIHWAKNHPTPHCNKLHSLGLA